MRGLQEALTRSSTESGWAATIGPVARRVGDALLEPRVAAVEHVLRGRVVGVVVVGPQLVEQRVDAAARLRAEQVGQLERLLAALRALALDRVARRPRPRRSRTARRRCRRSGRGTPAAARAWPASGSSRRTSSGRACASERSAKRRCVGQRAELVEARRASGPRRRPAAGSHLRVELRRPATRDLGLRP